MQYLQMEQDLLIPTFQKIINLVSSQIEYLNDNKLIKIVDILGSSCSNHKGFQLNIYITTVKKEYNLSY